VVDRTVHPLGLVVQGGTWYLVGRTAPGEQARIYRVSRIEEAEVLDGESGVDDEFDLVAFWLERKEDFHMTRSGYAVTVRAKPWALRALRHEFAGAVPAGDDWVTAELSFGTRGMAFERLLGLGAGVEVLEPDDLRLGISEAIGRMSEIYS
jgi:predicted DNA-binding transcriptional regulator YafY